ncbi:MAG TPA: MMPL family transporter [Gaiellaceae bacterium]|nr:MMPL family transporter [Gaiellaceae bacterium]
MRADEAPPAGPQAGEEPERGGAGSEPEPTSRLARLYAWLIVWLAPLVILAVLAGAAAAYRYLPSIAEAPTATTENLLPSNPKALQVERESTRLFGAPLLTPYAVVQRNPNGLSRAVQEQTVRKAAKVDQHKGPVDFRDTVAVPIFNTLGVVPGSREHGTTAITYLFFRGNVSSGTGWTLTQEYARYLGPGLDVVGGTGAIPARIAQFDVLQSRLHWTEGATIALILLIVGVAFRAVAAPLLTVLTAGIAFVISQHILGYIASRTSISMPNELTAVAVALMLGIVTDYSVFYFTGTRERLRLGDSRREAVQRTTAVNTPIVFTAGLVVSVGVASLLLGTLGFFRGFGPGMAITVACGLLVSMTVVPATLRLLGPLAFWPGLRSGPVEIRAWRRRVARFATRRSVSLVLVLAAAAGLVLCATGLSGFSLGFALVRGLPSGNPVAQAAAQASQGFAPGVIAPTEVLVRAPGIERRRAALARLQSQLAQEPGVAGVIGPAQQPTGNRYGLALAPRGDAARYALVFTSDPTEARAIRDLERIQDDWPRLAAKAGLPDASVGFGGETALAVETVHATDTSLWRVLLGALGVNLVFLLLFLRSLLAPFYLLAASILALAATFGLTLWFFTHVLGNAGLPYYVPVAFSVLLLSLGSDYNIFVVGRIWQEAERRPLREAVAVAAPRAGRAVMVAGVALALSFALLAIVPIEPFAVMAFAMGVGILLDTMIVRTLLVPGLIVLFGRAGRWPRS